MEFIIGALILGGIYYGIKVLGANEMNKSWDKLEDDLKEKGVDVTFDKFKPSDIQFKSEKHKNKDGSLDKRFKENRN